MRINSIHIDDLACKLVARLFVAAQVHRTIRPLANALVSEDIIIIRTFLSFEVLVDEVM